MDSTNTDKSPYKVFYNNKLGIALCSALLPSFTLLVFGPLELYASNAGKLWFSIGDIALFSAGAFLLAMIVLTGALMLIKNPVWRCFAAGLFGMGLALYIQGNFLNFGYGVLDGNYIDWGGMAAKAAINTIIWIICAALPFIVLIKADRAAAAGKNENKKKRGRYKAPDTGDDCSRDILGKLICFVSLVIIAVQIATLIIVLPAMKRDRSQYCFTKENMFTVSSKENTIIFVLDTVGGSVFEHMLDSYTELKDEFKDFIYFDNAVGGGAPTIYGMPIMLTGVQPEQNEVYEDYLRRAYLDRTDLYKALTGAGYDIRLYTGPYLDHAIMPHIANMKEAKYIVTSHMGLNKKMMEITAFRYMPHILKKYFWVYTYEFDDFKGEQSGDVFEVIDREIYNDLNKSGLSVIDDKNAFRLYHLDAFHGPVRWDENLNPVPEGDGTTIYQQLRGSLRIVENYLDMLKEQNLYDNSNIAILADHGHDVLYQNPFLIVKPKGHRQDEMSVNHAPITFQELPATYVSFFSDNHSKYGRTIFDVAENEQRDRRQLVVKTLYENFTGKSCRSSTAEFILHGGARDVESIEEIPPDDKNDGEQAYKLGTVLDAKQGEFGRYIVSGIGEPEGASYMRWSIGNESKLRFELNKVPQEDLTLEMELYAFGEKTMLIYANDMLVSEDIYSDELSTVKIIIPQSAVPANELVLRMVYPDASSPKDSGINYDERSLAIRYNTLKIK